MSEAKFTEGPWVVHDSRAMVVPEAHKNRPIGGSIDKDYDLKTYAQEICAMHWPDKNRAESEVKANANLIAAAPELYELLSDLFHQCSDDLSHAANNRIAAILKKARGES